MAPPAPPTPLPPPIFTLLTFPGQFNAVGSGPICLTLVNRRFFSLADIVIRVNGLVATASSLFVSTSSISGVTTSRVCGEGGLVEGLNSIALVAKEAAAATNAAVLSYNASGVWAGSRSLVVHLVSGTSGTTFLGETSVTATLSNDVTVKASKVTSNGTVIFMNLPLSQTILLNAVTTTTTGNNSSQAGTAAALAGIQSNVTLPLFPVAPPTPPLSNATNQTN
jgi:hypothetical protein